MRTLVLPLALGLLLPGALFSGELTLEKLFDPGAMPEPTQTAWRPDGRMLTQVAEEKTGTELRGIDPATGKVTFRLPWSDLGLPPAPDADGTAPLSTAKYQWSPLSDALLFSGR